MARIQYDQQTNRTTTGTSYVCAESAEAPDSNATVLLSLRRQVLSLLNSPDYTPPSLPERALELEHMCMHLDTPVQALTAVISQDSNLTAAVLRAANSVFARRTGRTFTSLDRAVLQIGFNGLRTVTFAMSMRAVFLRTSLNLELMRNCFQHSLAVAHGASWLAERAQLDQGSAYVAGLLHDIGKVIVLHAQEKLAAGMTTKHDPAHLQELLDSLHQEVGSRFARSWGLSEPVVEVCSRHHRVGPRQGLTSLVASANRLTRCIGLSLRQPESCDAAFAELAQQGLAMTEIEDLIQSLQEHALGLAD
ncbi:MAG: HDOD domain-containing protein [Pseudomonadota bacterium]